MIGILVLEVKVMVEVNWFDIVIIKIIGVLSLIYGMVVGYIVEFMVLKI